MIALILSFFLISSPVSVAAPVVEQEQLSAESVHDVQTDAEDHPGEDVQDAQTDAEDHPEEDVQDAQTDAEDHPEEDIQDVQTNAEDDPDPADQEDLPVDEEEDNSDPADQEDPPVISKPQKDVIKEYQQYTIYQSASVQSDPVASDDMDYMEESYYLLVIIVSVLLFFLIVTICKLAYRFFDIFI